WRAGGRSPPRPNGRTPSTPTSAASAAGCRGRTSPPTAPPGLSRSPPPTAASESTRWPRTRRGWRRCRCSTSWSGSTWPARASSHRRPSTS
ncbi:MAG: Gamma-glutamyltranspeptidase @ Glutathione hydrolase, partial [uncultured Sphingomonadaceae bacterium]